MLTEITRQCKRVRDNSVDVTENESVGGGSGDGMSLEHDRQGQWRRNVRSARAEA